MGWTTGHRSKAEAFEAVGLRPEIEIVDRHPSREGDWLIVRHEGRLEIIIVRLKRYGAGDWGEGGAWAEEHGPCESGCPVAWFERVPLPTAEQIGERGAAHAAEFRERIRREHAAALAAKAKARSVVPGCVLRLPARWSMCGPFTAVAKKGRSWIAETATGLRVRLGPKALAAAEIIT
jgi:hypothetical protein